MKFYPLIGGIGDGLSMEIADDIVSISIGPQERLTTYRRARLILDDIEAEVFVATTLLDWPPDIQTRAEYL